MQQNHFTLKIGSFATPSRRGGDVKTMPLAWTKSPAFFNHDDCIEQSKLSTLMLTEQKKNNLPTSNLVSL